MIFILKQLGLGPKPQGPTSLSEDRVDYQYIHVAGSILIGKMPFYWHMGDNSGRICFVLFCHNKVINKMKTLITMPTAVREFFFLIEYEYNGRVLCLSRSTNHLNSVMKRKSAFRTVVPFPLLLWVRTRGQFSHQVFIDWVEERAETVQLGTGWCRKEQQARTAVRLLQQPRSPGLT